jgi:hypothetical protein
VRDDEALKCERCRAMLPPNRCRPCARCGRQVHIDRGQLLWPVGGGICSVCYDADRRRLLGEAREWLLDCYPDYEQDIRELDDRELRAAVERHYVGGWSAFRADT